ncbi:MAG: hypothetical protein NTY25_08910 [Planctomycetia bacterium]|nr:hypothetical protein [Planctomycetia bacterium]
MKTLLSSQRPQVSDFLAALASGLPRVGLWSAPVIVGVSGGADSVGLLLGLHELASGSNAQLVVAHAKHDLRLSAADDEAFVAALAGRLGLQMALIWLARLARGTWRWLTRRTIKLKQSCTGVCEAPDWWA